MKKYVITLIISLLNIPFSFAQIGSWKAYMAYSDVQQIVKAGDHLFVRASNSLYQYNLTDQSIITYDKVNGLSDTYITHIAWNQKAKQLIAVYDNSNIDLIDLDGNITNISALYRKTMTEDKTVDSLTIDDIYAYLYARFGIVKVNMQRAEIADTYTKNHPEYPTSLPLSNANKDWDDYIDIVNTLKPGGPKYNSFGFLRYHHGHVYSTNAKMEEKANIQMFDGNDWTIFENDLEERLGHRFVGMNDLDIDPFDEQHVIAAGQTGVYEFQNGKFVKEYTNDNSPLKTASTVGNDNKNYIIMYGSKFDAEGNYWCMNSISPSTSLFCLTKDGIWKSLHHSELMLYNDRSLEQMEQTMFDSRGFMWFVNNHWRMPALIRYDVENDAIKRYNTFVNQDGTSYVLVNVTSVLEDLSGNIWIATNKGPFYLPAENITSDDETFYQVKVPRNDGSDYADYLLNGVDITAMAIDGGGRKWFGTRGDGVYLISADNMQQIHHFTTSDSYILSDNIRAICINDNTGEVFFATDKGLCSYYSDATPPVETMTKDNVYAYPNPVTPDYTGLITINGLTLNADVKICSSSGKLIAEGRSNGGTFTWDGCDQQGRRVASGVYMVITATSDTKKGTVCKIAIIR